MEDHDDFAFEPVPGLPEQLPRGETMLWQGTPEWKALAISAFRIRPVGAYFALLLAWEMAGAWRAGASASALFALSTWIVGLAAVAIGILCGLAYFYARGTIYTLTTRRIIIRSGLALPITLNLPLSLIDTAAVGAPTLGTRGITLAVSKPNRVAWLVLWPNVRPWTFTNPQPMLRCLPDADAAASLLAKALEADAGTTLAAAARAPAPSATLAPMPSGATVAA